jgi:hypothetical protein
MTRADRKRLGDRINRGTAAVRSYGAFDEGKEEH